MAGVGDATVSATAYFVADLGAVAAASTEAVGAVAVNFGGELDLGALEPSPLATPPCAALAVSSAVGVAVAVAFAGAVALLPCLAPLVTVPWNSQQHWLCGVCLRPGRG